MRFSTIVPFAALTFSLATAAPIVSTEETSLLTFLSSPYSIASNLISSFSQSTDDKEKTIWQLLNEDKDKYSKIVKLIEIDGTAKKILDDREAEVTFFAPENSGIPDPHHHDDDDDDDEEDFALSHLIANPTIPTLHSFHSLHLSSDDDDDEDDKKKRRQQIFLHILSSVLKYHGLAKPYAATDLAGNSTFETVLTVGEASGGEGLRIRVEKKLLPPSLELNFYAKVSGEQKAINGYLHTIDHPLFPPPSILTAAFLFPNRYSTLTSAIQKVNGTGFIGYEIDPEATKKEKKAVFIGSPSTTLFAPTNEAFAKLPEKFVLFLFSPFGERVLAKLLAYHVLPKQVLFSESYHSAHHHHKKGSEDVFEVMDGGFHKEARLPTLLEGESLKVVVDKKEIIPIIPGAVRTTITVNDIQVEVIDVPALNGAAHSLGDVLKPPHKHHDHESGLLVESEWKDWEHWLVDWAVQADFA